jgi:hypothetical protein
MQRINVILASALKTARRRNELIVSPDTCRYKASDFV